MHPIFTIFGREVSAYSLMAIIGFGLGLLYMLLAVRQRKLKYEDAIYIFVLGIIGAIIGAKVVYILTVLPQFVSDLPVLFSRPGAFLAYYLTGGMVFYGGLIGGLASALLAAKYFGKKLEDFYPVLIPPMALFCAFGRIGCFLAGCCYGKETASPLHVIFHRSQFAPDGVPLVPTQLYEAAFDIGLFILMIVLGHRKKTTRYMLAVYLLIYGIFRFILEFFRGDEARGIFGGLSTSQWISIGVILWGILLIIRIRKQKTDQKTEQRENSSYGYGNEIYPQSAGSAGAEKRVSDQQENSGRQAAEG